MNKVTRRAALATPLVALPAMAVALPDAGEQRMIALCDAYIHALTRFNNESDLDSDDCPIWAEAERARVEIDAWEPATLPGIVAAARVAEALAAQGYDSINNWDTSFTGHWPGTVVQALLRLHG